MIFQMLRLIEECNKFMGQFIQGITSVTGIPSTPPMSPMSMELSLSSTLSPLSTDSILSDDAENVALSTLLVQGTLPCDPAAFTHVSKSTSSHLPSWPMNTRCTYARAHRVVAPSFNLRGLFALFVSGRLMLDGRVQHMYNNFLYDFSATKATRQLYLITCGRHVGIFSSW